MKQRLHLLAVLLAAFVVCLIILSGDAYADPSSDTHQFRDHKEYAVPMYCTLSYLRMLEAGDQIHATEDEMLELYTRGSSLYIMMLDSAKHQGHTPQEVDDAATALKPDLDAMEWDLWLDIAVDVGCKEMTNAFLPAQQEAI